MTRPFPPGRIGLKQLLSEAQVSKNTFFLKYRNDPVFAQLLDIREDRDQRLHFAANAGQILAAHRGDKPRHGNAGRSPHRPCPACGASLHPRLVACVACGKELALASLPTETPRRSTAKTNYLRSAQLDGLRNAC